MFSLEKALAEAGNVVANRRQQRSITYAMYCSNEKNNPHPKKVTGYTIKQLQNEFYDSRAYKFAVITPLNNPYKYLRVYDYTIGKKFISLSKRTRKAKK